MATPALESAAICGTFRTIESFPLAAEGVRPFFFSVLIVERIMPRPWSSCRWQLQWGKPIQKPLQGLICDQSAASPFPSFEAPVADGGIDAVTSDPSLDRGLGNAHRHMSATALTDRGSDRRVV
jgi:hypothetical protein